MRRQVLVLGTALLVWVAAASASMDTSGPHGKRPPQAARVQRYGALPLAFELNAGQANPTVKFVAKGRGYSVLLTAAEAVVALHRPSGHPSARRGKAVGASGQEVTSAPVPAGMTIRMAVVGANPGVEVIGVEQLPGKANYFVGNDSRKWRTGIPTYAKVRLDGIYRGIDLVYYGREGQLEYDFVISPGADAAAVALALVDAAGRPLKMHIDAGGDLIVPAGAEQIRFAKPVMYQVDAKGTTKPVHGSFALKGEGKVGFHVGAYDQTRPLVIDPVLQYSTFYGGSERDTANAIAVDGAGNAYITGFTRSFDDFPTNTAVSPHYGGTADFLNRDAFVAKLNADGTHYVYSTYLGGTGEDVGYGIAVDVAGNAYVTGNTSSGDFPLKNAYQNEQSGVSALFVTRLAADGASIAYSTLIGAEFNNVEGRAIAVDETGKAYVTGVIDHTSGYPTRNAFQTQSTCHSSQRGFVTRIDTTQSGNDSLDYSSVICATAQTDPIGNVYGLGIATDVAGNAYVIGATNASNIITKNAFQSTCGACKLGPNSGTQYNAFIMKVNTNASGDSSLLYSTYFGGNVSDAGYGIAVDAFGNAYVAGQASSSNFPTTTGVMQPTTGGGLYYSGGDAFIAKFDLSQSGASSLIWSTYLGGTADEGASALAIDSASNVFVTGWNNNGGFPTLNAPQSTFGGGVTNSQTGEIPIDAFVAKVKSDGTTLLYSTYLGGSGNDEGNGIAVDIAGNAYVAGITRSANFPTVAGYLDTLRGVSDGFVAKLHLVPDFTIGDLDPITIEVGGTGSTQVDIKSVDEFNSLVKFLVAGVPPGLVPSFNPDSVTPPVNGTASATMTVVAGPSVAAGNYSFTVRGEAGSPLSHDTTATVHVLATPDSVSEVIDTIHALGCMDNLGVSAALQVKLSQAEAAIAAGDIQTAINILTALLHQLQAQAGKHIARECTDENDVTFDPVEVLIDNITALLASLGAQLQPTVVMGRVTSAGGADIADATVRIMSGKTVVAAAETDATGFYFFPRTNGLKPGALYVVKVTLPKGYKVSTPASESFTWRATVIVLSDFALN